MNYFLKTTIARLTWQVLIAAFVLLNLIAHNFVFAQRNLSVDQAQIDGVKKEKRLALVIGNNGYPSAQLVASINDARAMTETLRKLNFDVVLLEDANQSSMNKAIATFTKILNQSDAIGLFYFAGHGVQSNNKNFLIPVDAKITKTTDIERQGVDIQSLLDKFAEKQSGMNILILDACRNNPFSDGGMKRSSGLAAVDGPPGTIVAFATAPGKVAQETGDHGAYTRSVLKHISEPGLPIEEIFKRVRSDVLRATNNAQVPWENTSLVRDFYFQAAKAGQGYLPTVATEDLEWGRIENSKNIYDFISFSHHFPSTKFEKSLLNSINGIFSRMTPRPPLLQANELLNLQRESSIGFQLQSVNRYLAEHLGLPDTRGALVVDIKKGSAAENSGLKIGDVLLAIADRTINDASDLRTFTKMPIGESLDLTVWRNNRKLVISTITERASINSMLADVLVANAVKNPERARLFAEYLALAGEPTGQYLLGLANLRGLLGAPKNNKEAEIWLTKAAKQNEPRAVNLLAVLYLDPTSGLVNDTEAFRLASLSAMQGLPGGAGVLALAYARGVGTPKDIFATVKWGRLAAQQGNSYGMYVLGVASINGEGGMPKNIDEAKRWLRQASELKNASAIARLKLLEGQ